MQGKNTNTQEAIFIRALDEVIATKAMLSHPFYEQWNRGELPLATIGDYSKQYYAHVKAFPTYVSAVHSRCDDLSLRQMLLENLIEEERGEENHPELWLRFAEGLGLSREDVKEKNLLRETEMSVSAMKKLTQSENYLEGVAALYAYESQIPEVAKTKREGLQRFFGIDDARSLSFFTVHEEADLIHRQVERDILARKCKTAESRTAVLDSADRASKALWLFLDGVYTHLVNSEDTA